MPDNQKLISPNSQSIPLNVNYSDIYLFSLYKSLIINPIPMQFP